MKRYRNYDYTPEGWFIENAFIYNEVIKNPKKYKRIKLIGLLHMLIPMIGIILYSFYMEEKLGVSIL